MVVEARIRVRHRGCFTARLHGPMHGAQVVAERDADVLVVHGPAPENVDALVASIAQGRPRSPEIVDRAPTSVVLRLRGAPHATAAEIVGAGCTILWPALFANGEETYTVLAAGRDELDALVRKLAAHGSATLDRVSDVAPDAVNVHVPLTDLTTALTERQLVVLRTAIQEGYYDSPRRTSTEALAAAFGVTRSTLEEHLRKAERRVLEGFAGVLAAQPVLASAAARRPGRPARTPAR